MISADPEPVRSGVLIDTSALAVAQHAAVAVMLGDVLRSGAACTCPILDAEALSIAASSQDYAQLAADRRLAYRAIPLSAAIGDRMGELQALLARHAHLGRATPGDLQVAATALESGLRVVHYSAAFALLGQLCALKQIAVVPLGSLE